MNNLKATKKWSISDTIFVLAAYILAWFILGMFLPYDVDQISHYMPLFFFEETLDSFLLMGLTFYCLLKKRGGALRDIGLVRVTRVQNWFLGIGVGICVWGFSFSLDKLTEWLFGPSSAEHPYTIVIGRATTPGDYILISLVAVVLAPLSEEIFFRGFMYPAFRERYDIHVGALITSGIFALAHVNPMWFPSAFVAGLALTYLYELSGSLVGSIVAHGLGTLLTFLELVYFLR